MIDKYEIRYNQDENFKEYVDKYARQNRITVEEALKHLIVHEVCDYYEKG